MRLFCKHNWEIISKKEITIYPGDDRNSIPVGYRIIIIQRCTKCGKIEKKSINL